ncbi:MULTISPECIES: (Fe-S)-binding protein [Limnochorda]|uniref:(Fe-S)-binding protein n=1 Tax=Limnochorda TaxID=1676651 RepID=UPI0017FC4CDA|nr:(Fe-S)-binding protein [Limnochorda pilosa]MBO2485720.1 glycolate oxidase [Bacillota bacterium]MBO2518244.1 glycolate oxidase [Bacillota bacterium]NMA70937.1 (Fe-S)-binding protein [Bacillota bacterium]
MSGPLKLRDPETLRLPLEAAVQCMRCGFCLAACPTYQVTGLETQSPRGRIHLVRSAAEGWLDPAAILPALDLCIGCRACEPACPAGVPYGQILEASRAELEPRRPRPWLEGVAWRVVLRGLLGRPWGLRLSRWLYRLYRALGLQGLIRRTGVLERLLPPLGELEASLPSPERADGPARGKAPLGNGPRVAFFSGCVQAIALDHVNQAAIRVLEAAGCQVLIPPGQGCCGAVHAHLGDREAALAQARRNIEVFEQVEADWIVNVAGGCGAALKEYPDWLAGDPQWAERAQAFASRCRDFTELVDQLPLPELGPFEAAVTYQDSCHLRNVQGVVDPPRRLLRRVPGLRYVELPGAAQCCGAGGVYTLTQPAMSRELLDAKMAQVAQVGASVLAVANTPCHLQLLMGARRLAQGRVGGAPATAPVQVLHIAEILDRAIQAGARGAG